MSDERDELPRPSRMALVRRSVWGLVRAGAGRPAPASNYADADVPRFAGPCPPGADGARPCDTEPAVRVVSFNIDHGLEVDRAVALLERVDALRAPDVLLLQEMEERGSSRLAAALGMGYVYYPSGRHPVTGRHFGNAVLARGAIVADARHVLPHLGRVRGTARIAVVATVQLGSRQLTACSVHLATLLDASVAMQRDQLVAAIDRLDDVTGGEGAVIVGGDLNRRALGALVERRGFRWLTRDVGATLGPFAVDHLFARGVDDTRPVAAGVAPDAGGASDHRPVWSHVSFRG